MKLATLVTTVAAATLVVAQPALAATRSASSLPASGMKISSVESRAGSRLGASEDGVGVGVLPIVAIIAVLVALGLLVLDDDSFEGIDDLPDSP